MSSAVTPRPIAAVLFSVLAHVVIGQGLGLAPRVARLEPEARSFEVEMAPAEPEPAPTVPEPEPVAPPEPPAP